MNGRSVKKRPWLMSRRPWLNAPREHRGLLKRLYYNDLSFNSDIHITLAKQKQDTRKHVDRQAIEANHGFSRIHPNNAFGGTSSPRHPSVVNPAGAA